MSKAEVLANTSIFEKLEGDGSRSDAFFDERLAIMADKQPVWIPRDRPGIYDFFVRGRRKAYIVVTEENVVCYIVRAPDEYLPCATCTSLEEAVSYIETPPVHSEDFGASVGARDVLGNRQLTQTTGIN